MPFEGHKRHGKIVRACAILHNMIAADRGYEGTMKFRDEEEDALVEIHLKRVMHAGCRYEQARRWREECINIEDIEQHKFFT